MLEVYELSVTTGTPLTTGHPLEAVKVRVAGYCWHLSKYNSNANCICPMSDTLWASRALALEEVKSVRMMPVRMAMMAMTTSNSIRVKALTVEKIFFMMGL